MQAELRMALVDDLDQLIRLHDRELDGETLAALKATEFPAGLALAPADDVAAQAYGNAEAALAADPRCDRARRLLVESYMSLADGAIGKRAFYEQAELGLEAAYAHAGAAMVTNMLEADTAEGVCAFLDKRKPAWAE